MPDSIGPSYGPIPCLYRFLSRIARHRQARQFRALLDCHRRLCRRFYPDPEPAARRRRAGLIPVNNHVAPKPSGPTCAPTMRILLLLTALSLPTLAAELPLPREAAPPAWPKPAPVELKRDSLALCSKDLELIHSSDTLGGFVIRVGGKLF